jgi:uncharacterized protein YkwD
MAVLAALTGLGLLIVVASQSPAARAVTNCTVADASVDAEEQAFVLYLNDYRTQKGLQPLSISSNLNRAASWMAADMAGKNYFSHTDSLGRAPQGRVNDCGYGWGVGENIAAGATRSTGLAVFNAWVASAAHNANLLTSTYKQVGVARAYNASSTYQWYWVANFGTVDDGTGSSAGAAPTPTKTVTATPTKTASVSLQPGANLIAWGGTDSAPWQGLKEASEAVTMVYKFDPNTGGWLKYGPTMPGYVNNLTVLKQGEAYWVIVKSGIELQFTK